MTTIGWREWAYLPELDVGPIKVKVDTGAKTSALHAYDIEINGDRVAFKVHTIQGRDDFFIQCEAPLVEERVVRDSGGHASIRPVIRTRIKLHGVEQMAEVTLTQRHDMMFRMLLGRTAVAGRYLVDCSAEYLGGVPEIVHNWKPQ